MGRGKRHWHACCWDSINHRQGTIHVGDVPLNDENRQEWLTHCSAVFQDFTSYHLTARENISLGDLEHPERMEEAINCGGRSFGY